MNLLDQLHKKQKQAEELETRLADPSVISNPQLFREINEAYVELKEVTAIGLRYAQTIRSRDHLAHSTTTEGDEELRTLAAEEWVRLNEQIPMLEQTFLAALIPPDPMDNKDIIVEIRSGAGGDEASLFAAELMRMYMRYAEKQGWKTELVSANRNEASGFKEVIFEIKGHHAFRELKYESGVHRVQRVPETEKQGRVHTSTVTVAIMPEVEEVDVNIDPKDLIMETRTATGHGGQKVNKTESAIRLTHIPTGLMVFCQEERSQKQNKERALSILRARLFTLEQERAHKEREQTRRSQIGTADRSEKIRTYNFPQDRITDHRLNQNFHGIQLIMDGGIEALISALKQAEVQAYLSHESETAKI